MNHQQNTSSGQTLPKKSRNLKNCLRQNANSAIGTAIILVLCIHWHMAILHTTQEFQPHDLFLSSFSSSSSSSSSRSPKKIRSLQRQRQTSSRDDYILSPICGGCFRSNFDHRSCYTILKRNLIQSKGELTLLDAAKKLGEESEGCKLCDPVQCWKHYFNNNTDNHDSKQKHQHQSKYWKFDKASPKYTNPQTLLLPSIPSELRIPPSRFNDIGAYFQEKYELSSSTNSSMDYLVEYNPGLVVIPPKMKENLPPNASYLLSLRVTPANNCFTTQVYADLPKDVWNSVYYTATNHLGLALLDESYQMLPGYDVVVEIDVQLSLKRSTSTKAGDSVSPTFMDYRIFVLNNEIYLHVNADTVIVNRLMLRGKGFGDDDDAAYLRTTDTCAKVASENKDLNWETPCRLDNLYGGDNLQIGLMRQFNTIWSGGILGKNYALFGVPNATHPNEPDSIYAELDIFPHHVQQILPEEYHQLSKRDVFNFIWKPGSRKQRRINIDLVNMRRVKEVGNTTESGNAPLPSFLTADAHPEWFPGEDAPFKESAHGGACCVSFSAEELNLGDRTMKSKSQHRESLLVGIGHTKVIWKPWYSRKNVAQERKDRVPHTHYVTLFYAFDPYPPFQVRARSGYFCLGHAPLNNNGDGLEPSEGGMFNPHSILTRNRQLLQNNITFGCPQMSFVSSFTQKAGDSSKTVIGYGLNDCTGRLVEVEKDEIVRLLYPDPMDMIFD